MKSSRIIFLLLITSLVLAACVPSVTSTPPVPADTPETQVPTEDSPTPSVSEPEPIAPAPTEELLPGDEPPPARAEREFSTDFSIHSVPYSEILSGGPPKDGIPSIDQPNFVNIEEADEWIDDVEPVIQVSIDGIVKGYPLQILTWHEIVNDTLNGVPIVVTFCPLCNTAIAFERTIGDRVLDFGTSGRLRFSNLIMYDRQTESWWQQATGEAIVGELTGLQLKFVPAALISWAEFKQANPGSQVLSRDTGHTRAYGRNPYVGYDDINQSPFLYDGPPTPDALPPVARILALEFDGETVAYPYEILSEEKVVNDSVGSRNVAVFWSPGTASALDAGTISEGEDVGSAVAYDRNLDGQLLTFSPSGQNFMDNETGSTWNIQGLALSGPLSGQQLTEVVSVNHFWFSWAAFKPETRIYQPES